MEKLDVKIHVKVAIKALPEKIYPLITTAQGWDSWFTRGMVFNLEKKGEVYSPGKIGARIKLRRAKRRWFRVLSRIDLFDLIGTTLFQVAQRRLKSFLPSKLNLQ